ncbi:YwqG family protein [Actinoallomurus purpureus]|uniref:DUF1963 domain-containing protein n=1 Tax=Actinoallomurus purpureus TaxID=478114 RepID=UPI002091F43D|nr:DUF1963 domain-containing protein [Actinoallomurus purpureus]MCO6005154.1 YwqG family protein [Actinoallomurus purpureus]
MDLEEALDELRALCVEHLGEHVGTQLAALAEPASALIPATNGSPPGRSRLGGPALLDPGTAWPEYEGYPLSLLAVIDTAQLGPWAGASLPGPPSLLNFFFLEIFDLDDPEVQPYLAALPGLGNPLTCRIVPADPAYAAEVHGPARAISFSSIPLDTAPGITLPDFTDDPALNGLDLGPHAAEGIYGAMPGLFVEERFGPAWADYTSRQPLYDDRSHQCFGWPTLGGGSCLQTSMRPEEEFTHILELSSTREFEWGDGGSLHFVSPSRPLRDGDFSHVVADSSNW